MKNLVIIGVAALTLAACQTSNPLQMALSGKSLVDERNTINLNEDGTITGSVTGTWRVSGNRFCRTITDPVRVAGTACQDAELGDGTLTVITASGPRTFAIE